MSDDVEVVEGHPEGPEGKSKMLTPGAQARVFRDGNVLEALVLVPQSGPLELRHLAPGAYVIKDETGGEVEVAIHPKVETTAVPTRYSARQGEVEGGSGEPGSSFTIPPMELRPGQTNQPSPSVESVPKLGADVDVPVLGEPGSALIEELPDPELPDPELPDPDDTPDRNLEHLAITDNEKKSASKGRRSKVKQTVAGDKIGTAPDEPVDESSSEPVKTGEKESPAGDQDADAKPARDVVASEPADEPAKDEGVSAKVKAEAQELKAKATDHAKTTEKK